MPTFGASQHLEDEWVYGQLCRLFRLSGHGSAERYILRKFGVISPSFEVEMRAVIESGCFGSKLQVAERATFQSYFRHFVGVNSGGRWPAEEADLFTVGRCYHEKGTVARGRPVNDGLRDCPECTSEQVRTRGFATWRRSHNLPGVKACWRHAVRLRARFDPEKLPMPDHKPAHSTEPATKTELWFANASYEALHDCGGSRRYANVLRGPMTSGLWAAPLLARGIISSYPAAFLSSMDLTPFSLTAGYGSIIRGQRSIGDTRLLILLSHCQDRIARLITGESSGEAPWDAWRIAAGEEGLTRPRLAAWVKADRVEELVADPEQAVSSNRTLGDGRKADYSFPQRLTSRVRRRVHQA